MKLRTTKITLAAMFMSASIAFAGPTRLQVFVTGDAGKAKSLVTQLNDNGFGPAVAEASADGKLHRVYTMTYGSLAEANFAKSKLAAIGFSDAFADEVKGASPADSSRTGGLTGVDVDRKSLGLSLSGSQSNQAKRNETGAKALDLKQVQKRRAELLNIDKALLGKKVMQYYRAKDLDGTVAAIDYYIEVLPTGKWVPDFKLMKANILLDIDVALATAQYSDIIQNHADNPAAGDAALRMAYLELKPGGSESDALALFRGIASGDVEARPETQLEALMRLGAMYQRGRDRDNALATFQEAEGVASDPEVKAYASLQQAGLLLEKSWNGTATFAQAQAVCDSIPNKYPDVASDVLATASLMGIECSVYTKNYNDALKRGEKFRSEFSNTAESILVDYWVAKSKLESGRTAEAATEFEELTQGNVDVSSRFRRLDVRTRAFSEAITANERLGRIEKAAELRQLSRSQ